MNNTAMLAGLIAIMGATPALAEDRTYVGVDAGAVIAPSYGIQIVEPGGTVNHARIHDKTGIDLDLVAGHDFGPLRLEGEASWKHHSHKSFRNLDNGISGALEGHTETFAIMANALLTAHAGPATLFAGPGIGWGHSSVSISDGSVSLKKSSDQFAWQAQVGGEVPVSQKLALSLKYRYFQSKLHFDDADINPDDTNLYSLHPHSHSVLAGVRYAF